MPDLTANVDLSKDVLRPLFIDLVRALCRTFANSRCHSFQIDEESTYHEIYESVISWFYSGEPLLEVLEPSPDCFWKDTYSDMDPLLLFDLGLAMPTGKIFPPLQRMFQHGGNNWPCPFEAMSGESPNPLQVHTMC